MSRFNEPAFVAKRDALAGEELSSAAVCTCRELVPRAERRG